MENKIEIYCDGGAIGNPGPAACAFIAYENKKLIYQFSKAIGRATNNVAEYQAVIVALEWLNHQSSTCLAGRRVINHQYSSINFYLDSQLVVNQLNGFYKIKNSNLRLLIIKAKGLEQSFNGKIYYHQIPREKNKTADKMVKIALRQDKIV